MDRHQSTDFECLDEPDGVRLTIKLRTQLRTPTSVGGYKPAWAIIKHEEGEDRSYATREAGWSRGRGTSDD